MIPYGKYGFIENWCTTHNGYTCKIRKLSDESHSPDNVHRSSFSTRVTLTAAATVLAMIRYGYLCLPDK